MPQCPDEAAAVTIRDKCHRRISGRTADGDDNQKLARAVAGRACSGEDKARGKRKRYCCRGNERPRSPFLKKIQRRGHFTVSKFAAQICRSGLLRQSECKDGADNGAGRGYGRVLVPGVTMSGRENSGQDVGAAKRGERRAVKDCQKEKP